MDAGPAPSGDRGRAPGDGTEPAAAPSGPRGEGVFRVRLGAQLREIRLRLGMSLVDVQHLSDGAISAPALSSYERADRAISAARLALLAGIYGVAISELLPTRAGRASVDSHPRVEFDLPALRAMGPHEVVGPLIRFLEHVARLRKTDDARIAVRNAELAALAALCQLSVGDLVDAYGTTLPVVP